MELDELWSRTQPQRGAVVAVRAGGRRRPLRHGVRGERVFRARQECSLPELMKKVTDTPLACPGAQLVPRTPDPSRPPIALDLPVRVLTTAVNDADGSARAKPQLLLLNADGQIQIRALSDTVQLQVNGRAVREARLRDGDAVQLGT